MAGAYASNESSDSSNNLPSLPVSKMSSLTSKDQLESIHTCIEIPTGLEHGKVKCYERH